VYNESIGSKSEVAAGEILLGSKKKVVIMREVQHRNNLLREVVETPSLEIFQPQLDKQP